MSRRKADYVYVPKKKIKKIVIDATKGNKPVEKVITQQQILDGAYVRAAALKEFRNYNFAHGGMTKNYISVGDVVREKNSGVYFIVYEVKNGVATKSYVLPTNVGEAIAFANDPSQIDLDKYTMYSDQSLNSNFSVGDMVYVEKHRKSGVIISKGSLQNGEMYYTVKFANDTQDSFEDYELELISTYKRGGNIGSYNTGRSWTQDHNQHNKSESYEIPMDDRKFAKGGTIKNQYADKTAREVWGMWTPQQRVHFLGDHYLVGEYRPENIDAISKMTYDELRDNMATISGAAFYTLQEHIARGQYKRGGNIGSYNTGRSWTLDHNQHNKSESYEIPMDDRKFATGGDIPDLSNMNIDHLFANGGRTYPTTEEKIYS
jgi:hypothetical protein